MVNKENRILSLSFVLLFIFLFLIISPIFYATTFFNCPSCTKSYTSVDYNKSTGYISATVLAFNGSIDKVMKDASKLRPIDLEELGTSNATIVSGSINLTRLYFIENAKVHIYIYNQSSGGKNELDCNLSTPNKIDPLITDEQMTITDEGSGDSTIVFYGSCYLDSSKFDNSCIKVSGSFDGLNEIGQSSTVYGIPLCFGKVDIFEKVNSAVYTSILNAFRKNKAICVLSFLLLGILFSTLFYSGRSPLALFDLTSPKLPSPKSIAVSGRVGAPMSYGRVKNAIMKSRKKMNKFLNNYLKDSRVTVPSGLSSAPAYLRALYARAVERGDNKLMREIELVVADGRINFSKLQKIISSFQRTGDMLDSSLAYSAMHIIKGGDLLEQMSIFGGSNEEGVAPPLKNKVLAITKLFNGLPLFGAYLGSTMGNLYSSHQFLKRIGRSFVSSLTIPLVNLVIGKDRRRSLGEKLRDKRKVLAKANKNKRIAGRFVNRVKDSVLNLGEGALLSGDANYIFLGRYMPILNKIDNHYNNLMKAAQSDIEYYLLRMLYKKMGLDEELSGGKDILFKGDVETQKKKFAIRLNELFKKIKEQKPGSFNDLESELFAIYKTHNVIGSDRINSLLGLISKEGIKLDSNLLDSISKLEGISHIPNVVERWDSLTGYLSRQRDTPISKNGFYFLAGRADIKLSGDEIFRRNMFSDFVRGLEFGDYTSNYINSEGSFFLDTSKSAFIKLSNEVYGIQDPKHVSDKDVKQLMASVLFFFKDLAKGDVSFGGINDIVSLLNDSSIYPGKEGFLGLPEKGSSNFPDVSVAGPKKGAWKVDMQWMWRIGKEGGKIPESDLEALISSRVHYQFDLGMANEHIRSYEEKAKEFGLDRAQKRELYTTEYLKDRLVLMLNERSNASFGKSFDSAVSFYRVNLANMIRNYVASNEFEYNGDKNNLVIDLKRVSAGEVLDRVLENDNGEFGDNFFKDFKKNYLSKPLTYNRFLSGAFSKTSEGEYVPINEESNMSALDAGLSAVVAYRDQDTGKFKEFDSQKFDPTFELNRVGQEGKEILDELNKLRSGSRSMGDIGVDNPEKWIPLLSKVRELAERGKISGGVVVYVGNAYANTTGDHTKLTNVVYDGERVVKILSRKEFIDGAYNGAKKYFAKFKSSAASVYERNIFNTFGTNIQSLEMVNRLSTLYRHDYIDFASSIYSGLNRGEGMGDAAKYAKQLRAIADSAVDYNDSYETTIDRHPMQMDTGIGETLWKSAGYHHGPKAPYKFELLGTSYYSKYQKGAMKTNNLMIESQRKAMVGLISMYRTFQFYNAGRTAPYEYKENSMNPFPRVPVSRLAATSSLLSPFKAGWDLSFGKFFNWQTETTERKLHGTANVYAPRAFSSSPEDSYMRGKDVYIGYITRLANPNSVYLDSRGVYHFEPTSAAKPVYYGGGLPINYHNISGDSGVSFDVENNPNFYSSNSKLFDSAHQNLVRREVSSIYHTIARDDEVRMYGGSTRILKKATIFAPLALGGFRAARWIVGGGLSRSRTRFLGSSQRLGYHVAESIKHPVMFAKSSYHKVRSLGADINTPYCSVCGTPMPRGGKCPNPTCRSNQR